MQINEREFLMKKLMAERFAMIETILFLDTHPEDKEALCCLKKYRENYNKLYSEFEEKFGMLSPFSDTDCDSWKWIKSPWPWE